MGQRSSSQKKATETSTAKLSDFLPSNTCKDLKSKTLHTTSKPSLNLSQKIQLVLSLRSKNSSTHDPIKGENKLPLLRKKGVSLTDVNSRLFSNNFTPFKEDDRKIKRNTNMKFINISPNNLNKMKKEKNRLSMLKIMGISSNSDFDSKNLSLRSNRNSIIKRSFFGSKSKIVKSEDSSPIKEKEKPNLLKIITNKHIIDHLKQKEDQNKNEIKENNNASNDEKNIKKEEETNIFKSPLIKAFKIDKISTSSILTANYNEHMNRKKENQQKNHDVIKKKKAMKQFLNVFFFNHK